MKPGLILALVLLASCSSPTAPTPAPMLPPVGIAPPVVIIAPPTPDPLLSDPRFNLSFYRQMAHNAFEAPHQLQPLRRQAEAPHIYLRTIDDAGRPIDAVTLDETAAAMESTTGHLTGVFGLAGIERGTEDRQGQRGWITVRWSAENNSSLCGTGIIGGDLLVFYPRSNCRCRGGPAVSLMVVKHELGHVLGYYHTDDPRDLMYNAYACDKNPSDREMFHARVAYTRAIGSAAP